MEMVKRELVVVPAVMLRLPLMFHRSQLVPAPPAASLISNKYPPPEPQVVEPVFAMPGAAWASEATQSPTAAPQIARCNPLIRLGLMFLTRSSCERSNYPRKRRRLIV